MEIFFEPERREGFAVDGDDVGGGIEHCRNPSDEALLAKNAMSVKASARGNTASRHESRISSRG